VDNEIGTVSNSRPQIPGKPSKIGQRIGQGIGQRIQTRAPPKCRAGDGLGTGLRAYIYPAWWASLTVPATPYFARAATEAIMPGAVPGLVGML
jgi:hypothetical protein